MIRFIEAPVSSSRSGPAGMCCHSGERRCSWKGPTRAQQAARRAQAEISALKGGKIRSRFGTASRLGDVDRGDNAVLLRAAPLALAAPGPPSNSTRTAFKRRLRLYIIRLLLLLLLIPLLPKSFALYLYSALTSGRTASAYWRACRQHRRALPAWAQPAQPAQPAR